MKKLFAILAILGVMSVGLPSVLLAQDSPAVEDSVAQSEQVACLLYTSCIFRISFKCYTCVLFVPK